MVSVAIGDLGIFLVNSLFVQFMKIMFFILLSPLVFIIGLVPWIIAINKKYQDWDEADKFTVGVLAFIFVLAFWSLYFL
jgi:hypothetical protein